MNSKYGFGKFVDYDYETAFDKTKNELQKEGFGILTDIDVSATFKKKLNLDMPAYHILGACNPQFAHQALTIDPSIGLLLPCNIVIRQTENGKVYIEIMDPNAVLEMVKNPEINKIASEVRNKLEKVLQSL